MRRSLNVLKLSPHHPLRKTLGTLIVGVLASCVALLSRVWPLESLTRSADWLIYDQLWQTRSREKLDDPSVVIMRISDDDLRRMASLSDGRAVGYPWPRSFWGTMVEYLAAVGAREVVFDLQFSEPSVYQHLDDDEQLRASIDRVRATMPVVLAAKLRSTTDASGRVSRRMEDLTKPLQGLPRGVVSVEQGTTLRILAGSVEGEPSLALAALRELKVKTPAWAEQPFLLRWYGPAQSFPYFSASLHVLAANDWDMARVEPFKDGERPKVLPAPRPEPQNQTTRDELARLKGKIVLVGGISAATYDLYTTPLASLYPGPEMHATAIENMIREERTERVPDWAVVLAIVSTALATAAATIFPRETWVRLAAGATMLLALIVAAVIHFGGKEVDWVPLASPLVAGFLGTVGGFGRNYLSEDARRRLMTKAMGQYVAPEVARQIERRPEDLRLEAEQRVMTCLFSDMAGFTDFSEAAEIGVLTKVLNVYMERMSAIVLEEGGTIDKYIGDAIMAFWNAPLFQKDHAVMACRAALRMKSAEARVRDELLADDDLVAKLRENPKVHEWVKGMGDTARGIL